MKKVQNIFTTEDESKRSGLDLLRNFSQPTTFVSGVLLLLVVLCATFAPLIAPTDPYDLSVVSILDGRLAPGEQTAATGQKFRCPAGTGCYPAG